MGSSGRVAVLGPTAGAALDNTTYYLLVAIHVAFPKISDSTGIERNYEDEFAAAAVLIIHRSTGIGG